MLFNEFYDEENYRKLDDVLKTFKDEGELVRSNVWDKLAFGIIPGEQVLFVKDLKVKYPVDYENAVLALKKGNYFKDDFDSLPPIEVKYQNGKLYIEDGYHRYV